jgi:hypothetical protein
MCLRASFSASVVSLASFTAAFGDQVALTNPSFEVPAMSTCGFGLAATGWTSGAVWNPGTGTTCVPFNCFPAGVADGLQVGFTNSPNTPIKQVTSVNLTAGVPYTLLVDVGERTDAYAMQAYAVRLVSNGIVLAEDNNTLEPPPGGFLTSTVSFTAPANHPALGHPIEIHLVLLAGPQADFDNVRFWAGGYSIEGDVNGDGHVNASDLATLLGSWGACGSCSNCPADLNDDCTVNAADLAVLLGNWTG